MSRLVLILSVVPALAASGLAETYVVNPQGTGDFATIQEAVDAVSDGDVIELTDGVFRGDGNRDVDFSGKAITIRSQGGDPSMCIVDCEGSEADPHRAFLFRSDEGHDSVLEGLTITNGCSPHGGGGVLCDHGSPTIAGCVFLQNSSPENEGGGALFWASAAVARHCVFAENTAELGAGAASCMAADATFEWCTFMENTAERGGGLRV